MPHYPKTLIRTVPPIGQRKKFPSQVRYSEDTIKPEQIDEHSPKEKKRRGRPRKEPRQTIIIGADEDIVKWIVENVTPFTQ